MTDPINNTDTKPCKCGKKMIKRFSGMVLMSNPPQYPWDWWCGGCGTHERGGVDVPATETEEQRAQKAWEAAQ